MTTLPTGAYADVEWRAREVVEACSIPHAHGTIMAAMRDVVDAAHPVLLQAERTRILEEFAWAEQAGLDAEATLSHIRTTVSREEP